MGVYNHCTLVGNLTDNPVLTEEGKKKTATFTICVERYAGKDKESDKDYFDIVTTGKLAEMTMEHLKEGRKVLVDGRMQINNKKEWKVITDNLKFLRI